MSTNNWSISKKRFIPYTILGFLLVCGFFLRIYDINSPSLWIDEGFSVNASLATLENGYPILSSGEIYTSSLLHTYVTAFAIKLFGFDSLNPWSARIFSVFFGVLVILLSYILSRKIFRSNLIALVIATLITFSFWEIEWSRQARGYIQMQFFMLASLIFFWEWLKKYDFKNMILTLVAVSLAVLSQSISLVLVPAMAVILLTDIILHPNKIINKKTVAIFLSVLAMIGLYFALPRIFSTKLYDFTPVYFTYLFENLAMITWGSVLGIALGIFDKKRFWPVLFLTISLLFQILLIVWFSPLVQLRYLLPVFPIMIMLSVYGIWRVIELLAMQKFCILRIPVFIVSVLLLFESFLVFVPQTSYHFGTDSPRPNFKMAYEEISKSKEVGDVFISPYAHLSQLYLGERGYWLPISLTGKKSELEKTIVDGKYDYYVGAPIIKDSEHLFTLLSEEHGFVIIDGMSRRRLGERVFEITEHPNIREIYFSGEKELDKIWVYRF